MCIGLTIVVTPPLAVLSACSCWWLGQNAGERIISSYQRLDRNHIHDSSSDQQASNTYNVSSYLAGAAVLVPVYWAQTPLIRAMGGDTGHSSTNNSSHKQTTVLQQRGHRDYVPPHKATVPFRPPQTVPEMWKRMGRPVVARLMACSVACFCAGVVQAAVGGT